jgi:two-component system, NtrC family, sensor histidine kinase HydH
MPNVQKAIEREELSRVFGYMVAIRAVAVPLLVLAMGWVLWIEPTPWHRAVLGVAVVAIPIFIVVELVRYRRGGLSRSAIPVNLLAAAAGQLAVAFASGGVQSPFMVVAIPLGILVAVTIKPPLVLVVPLVQVAAVWAMAAVAVHGLVPDFNLDAFGGGSRVGPGSAHVWAMAVMLTFVLVISQLVGRALRKTFESILRRKLAAQQESLREHRERAEELTALSAEIAHELKNPLASVKGLSGLLSQHLPDGKGAERLAVLRREVDRMQSILDEFLNFSRPLVPLALGECDVAALCREVAALHEGMARERAVTLSLEGAAVTARCDPRKVKQVLINLVQNALDASPAGGEVRVVAEPGEGGGGALVRVLDRGRGVDPMLGESIFRPGITTKANGSGLGLTIARSLARQHGGDLLLRARTGGGTEALLVLPAVPAESDPGRAA